MKRNYNYANIAQAHGATTIRNEPYSRNNSKNGINTNNSNNDSRFEKSAIVVVAALIVVAAALSSFIISGYQAFAEPTNYIGSYSIQSPKITLLYTEPVAIKSKSIIAQDVDNVRTYELCQYPQGESTYSTQYTLSIVDTSTSTAGTCDGTPILIDPGDYQISIQAFDKNGNSTVPYPIDTRSFTISGLKIILVAPGMGTPASGISSTPTFDIIFKTGNDSGTFATCRYSMQEGDTFDTMKPTAEGSLLTINHKINSVSYTGPVYVVCKESSGRMTSKTFTVGYDATRPSINVTADPQRVTNPNSKYTSFIATTDDKTYCEISNCSATKCGTPTPFVFNDGSSEDQSKFSLYNTTHQMVYYYSKITDTDEHEFKYNITCSNLAGLKSTAFLNVTVNFGDYSDISIISPPNVVNVSEFDLIVEPSFAADSCNVTYNKSIAKNMTRFDGTENQFSTSILASLGDNSLFISCKNATKTTTKKYVVTYDPNSSDEVPLNNDSTICTSSSECTQSQVCSYYGLCVENGSVSAPCSTSADCNYELVCSPSGECEENTSSPQVPCTTSADCNGNQVCSNFGTCVENGSEDAPCTTSADCDGNLVCEPPGNCAKPTHCTANSDCTDGSSCSSAGICEQSKSHHILSWILLIVGIIIMIASGCFLYDQDDKKRQARAAQEAQARASQAYSQRRGFVAPAMNPNAEKLRAEQAAKRAAMHEVFQKRLSEKNAQRSSFFNAFDNRVDGDSTQGASKATDSDDAAKQSSAAAANSKKSEDGSSSQDDFIELSELKNTKGMDAEAKKTESKGKVRKSAFDDLDNVIKKTKDGSGKDSEENSKENDSKKGDSRKDDERTQKLKESSDASKDDQKTKMQDKPKSQK